MSLELQQAIQSYENYISDNGIDESVIDAMIEACKVAYQTEKDIPYALKVSERTKEIIENFVLNLTGTDIWGVEKYSFENKIKYEIIDKFYEVLLLEAQNKIVDSGFRYLERKREPKERFYMPRRKQFLKIGLVDALQGMIDDKYDILCISLIPGAGKTSVEKFFNALVIGWFPKDFTLFYSHSGDITRMYYDGVYDIVTNTDEYTWNEIFPDLHVTSTNAKMEQFNVGKYKPFPSVQCTSVGSKNAGKVRASKFLLVDDMIGGIEEAMNPSILDKLWDKYAVDARQRKIQDTDGKNCKEIHIATRWSVHDVIGRIQNMYAGNPRVKVIAVPDIDPVTGESNFEYEYSGFTKEFFADQQLLIGYSSFKLDYVVKWLNDYFEFYGEAKVSCDDNGWIPVQGRLPEDNHKGIYDMQLVTLEDGEVCMGVYNNREKEWWTRKQEGERWYTNKHNVIAWQPLPEPYKEEKKC